MHKVDRVSRPLDASISISQVVNTCGYAALVISCASLFVGWQTEPRHDLHIWVLLCSGGRQCHDMDPVDGTCRETGPNTDTTLTSKTIDACRVIQWFRNIAPFSSLNTYLHIHTIIGTPSIPLPAIYLLRPHDSEISTQPRRRSSFVV